MNELPLAIFYLIYKLLDNKSHNIFLIINHYLRQLVIIRTKILVLKPPEMQVSQNDIIIRTLQTFVNARKLYIKDFNISDEKYIKELFNYNNEEYKISRFELFNPLNFVINAINTYLKNPCLKFNDHIKTLKFRELVYDRKTEENKSNTIRILNGKLLNSLCHKNLESLTISINLANTSITLDSEVQPILNKCLRLQKFKFYTKAYADDYIKRNNTINLLFEKLTELKYVDLYMYRITKQTLTSLTKCTKLETLIINDMTNSSLDYLLYQNCFWKDLKKIHIKLIIQTYTDLVKLTNNYLGHRKTLAFRQGI